MAAGNRWVFGTSAGDRFEIRVTEERTERDGSRVVRVDDSGGDYRIVVIAPDQAASLLELHRLGHAHSVEVWQGGRLAGGLYGVAIGAAFFGESMFSRARDTSKLALVALVARLNAGGFRLLDTQFVTEHLAALGAVEITRADYRRRLAAALARPADFRQLPGEAPRAEVLALAVPGAATRP
jgi:leucyl/phenylalanyl-tRNA--protein transferase